MVAPELIRQVGRQARWQPGPAQAELRKTSLHHYEKAPSTRSPESDFASQQLIVNLIQQTFPDHGILAEEVMEDENEVGKGDNGRGPLPPPPQLPYVADYRSVGRHGEFRPRVSPVLRGPLPLRWRGAGVRVVYDPLREELFEAQRGGGPGSAAGLKVSRVMSWAQRLLATGFPYERAPAPPRDPGPDRRGPGHLQGLRRGGSAALDLAYVAAGPPGRLLGGEPETLGHRRRVLLVTEAGARCPCSPAVPTLSLRPTSWPARPSAAGLVEFLAKNNLLSREFLLKPHMSFNYSLLIIMCI